MKRKLTIILTLAAVACIGVLGIKNYPVPQEIQVPTGPLVIADGGMTNRVFTNRCVYVWRDTNAVHLKGIKVVNSLTGFWLSNAREVIMEDCESVWCHTGFQF